jgi:hypothetical protein
VFVSYSRRDRSEVERIADGLRRAGVEVWLDTRSLTPGTPWIGEIAAGLAASAACAVFVGSGGLGGWEQQEVHLALDRAANDLAFRLFPVLLRGVPDPFDAGELPPFLSTRTWVDLRHVHDDDAAIASLVSAVRGVPLTVPASARRRDEVTPHPCLVAARSS